MSKFESDWEPKLIDEKVVAKGTWFYQDSIAHDVRLIKQKFNYNSYDLPELNEVLAAPFRDYIDLNISDEGVLYFWVFSASGYSPGSPTFATYFQARDHLGTYGWKYEVQWHE